MVVILRYTDNYILLDSMIRDYKNMHLRDFMFGKKCLGIGISNNKKIIASIR
jgi:hypothetical protein